jgi:hypothetical protein
VGFSTPHILLTAVIAAAVSFAVLHFAASELRGRMAAISAILVGVATFALRFIGNVPALNDDFMPAVSINDVLGFPVAALAGGLYWAIWPSDRPRPPAARAWRWAAMLGLVGFVVNVVVI